MATALLDALPTDARATRGRGGRSRMTCSNTSGVAIAATDIATAPRHGREYHANSSHTQHTCTSAGNVVWGCSVCTYLNEGGNACCSMSQAARVGVASAVTCTLNSRGRGRGRGGRGGRGVGCDMVGWL
jgi:hypothetical protein